jgi:WD40 repeat protein
MSGYRNLHRESSHHNGAPIWNVQVLRFRREDDNNSHDSCWAIASAAGDGLVRLHLVQEKNKDVHHDNSNSNNDLNAAALSLQLSHYFVGTNQVVVVPTTTTTTQEDSTTTLLGATQLSIVRNYVGDDEMAGDIVLASLDLSGRVRVWTCPVDDLMVVDHHRAPDNIDAKQIKVQHEFIVENATGTIMSLCAPKLYGNGDLLVAVALLDGSIAMMTTGLATPKAKYEAKEAGIVMLSLGSGSIVMSLAWHPTKATLAVGRKDGLVEILPMSKQGSHRLIQHSSKVRAVCYTPDGELLVSASDDGFLAVWDVSNVRSPTLVHHVVHAHTSWILAVTPLSDSRRFITVGADGKVHVWSVGQMYAPLHTFHQSTTDQIWTLHASRNRLVSGSEQGWLQVYSLEEK